MFEIYLKLILQSLGCVIVAIAFFFIKRKTKFKNLNFWTQQIIIGVVFGLVSICGTEFGVDVGGAVANTRDAAPLVAGLIFGGPAGIIAGFIGGIERWFAVYWGAGLYSQVSCSISTALAGIYAALLRKYMFDNKRPSFAMGFAIGVVMEVFHLTFIFVTHLADAETALRIVQIVTTPMVLCNSFAVSLSIASVNLLSGGFKKVKSKYRKITQQIQSWLLLTIVIAFAFTTFFVYQLQSGLAVNNITDVCELNLADVKEQVSIASDNRMLSITQDVRDFLIIEHDPDLNQIVESKKISEINIIDHNGIITQSNIPENVNYDMKSREQSKVFVDVIITAGQEYYVQDFMPKGKDPSEKMKYAGYAYNGGIVQVGYDAQTMQTAIGEQLFDTISLRRVAESGYILFADDINIIRNGKNNGMSLTEVGFDLDGKVIHKLYSAELLYGTDRVNSHFLFDFEEGFTLITVVPTTEVFYSRSATLYINSYMEILIFAVLFAQIYALIKQSVVKKIFSVNNSLNKIIDGDLDIKIEERSSDEFALLSNNINSTVTTIKGYIEKEKERINKELAFAKSIQHSVLPSVFPAFPTISNFDIYATMDTAKEVGGDFYDFYMLDKDNLAFLIADVSGKGIPAAMFMMTAKSTIKNYAEAGLSVDEIMTRANATLCEGNDAGMFVTAWMGILNIHTGDVKFANAGHNPPLIYRKDGGYEYLKTKRGFVLAGFDSIKYTVQELKLNKGDKIFLYTDGVTEATASDGKLYGEERLLELLNKDVNLGCKETLAKVKEDIDLFVGEAEQFDDITMLSILFDGD